MRGLGDFNQMLWVPSNVIWSGWWSIVSFSRSRAKEVLCIVLRLFGSLFGCVVVEDRCDQ